MMRTRPWLRFPVPLGFLLGLVLVTVVAVVADSGGRRATIAELVVRAEVVLHARVLSLTCQRTPKGSLATTVSLAVVDVWKGQGLPSAIELALPGGRLGEHEVVVSGQPEYAPGEEVILFARWNDRRQLVTLGLGQGKFSVAPEPDPATGERWVRSAAPTHVTLRTASQAQSAPGPNRLSVRELRRRVQEVVR